MQKNDLRKDFMLFKKHPELVYLDSAATSQKPSYVLDWVKHFLENDYANIHRWLYSLSEKSEKLYIKSKKKLTKFINAQSWREIIYSFNSTYAINLLVSSLKRSKYFKKWDKVLLSIVEHHANIVPWLILKEEVGIEIDYINLKDDFFLDFDDLKNKLDSNVVAISLTHVSNVTWRIFDLEKVNKILNKFSDSNKNSKKPLFIVDASQSIPHFKVDVQKIWCDFMFFTGHKIMANTWIWVLWWKKDLLNKLNPSFSWWWAISSVKKDCFKLWALPDKFEPWTPNLSWAVSLLKALEYIENIWWYEKIIEIDRELVNYTLKKFDKFKEVKLIWPSTNKWKIWVFSFTVKGIHSIDVADYMAENNICIRAWQHCTEPFMSYLKIKNSCRMSLYIYNNKNDIDKFFEVLEKCIKSLS